MNRNKISGGLYGMLIGDALGTPYEFHSKTQIPPYEQIEMTPPVGFKRSHSFAQIGVWSDDGSQALCLLDSLLASNGLDLEDFAVRMLAWYEYGYMTPDGRVFDIGNQTSIALSAYKHGTSPEKSGADPNAKGNGALMRVLPLVLWAESVALGDTDLVSFAHRQCLPTHGAVTNQVCCALYCLVAKRLIAGDDFYAAFVYAVTKLRDMYADKLQYTQELESLNPAAVKTWQGHGGGYVVDCLKSAVMIMLRAQSYEQAVKAAVALGDDTDTTACVTGGLAGIMYGYESIPTRWIDTLKGKEKVEYILKRLYDERQ